MKLHSFLKLLPAVKTKIYLLPIIIGMLVFPQLFLSKSILARNQNPVILTDDKDTYEIGPYLEILEDKSGNLTIDDVTSPAFDDRFVKNDKKALNFGHTASVYWVRFKILNNYQKTTNWLLEQDNVFMYYVDFYEATGIGNKYTVKKLGFLRPAEPRDFKNHNFAFNLSFPQKAEKKIYLRFESENAMIIQLTIRSKDEFYNSTIAEYFGLGLFYGVLLIMLGYNLFVFISIRTVVSFYYIAVLFFMILFDIAFSGLGPYYIWHSARFSYISINLFTNLLLISIMKFTEAFVNMKNTMPVLYKCSTTIVLIETIIIIIVPFVKNSLFIPPATVPYIAGCVVSFAASIISLNRGNKKAYYYIFGCLILMSGISILILMWNGILPFNAITKNYYRPATIIFTTLWSLAIGSRINILKNQLEIASRDYRTTIDSMRDMIHVVDRNFNIILFNTAMVEMNRNLGLETDYTGRYILSVFPFLNNKTIEEYEKVLNAGEIIFTEETVFIKNRKFITETRKTPIIEQGTVTKIVTVIRDITERKQTEEQLRQAQKMEIVGTLAGGLAHDFNNVLNGIMGSVSLIKYQMRDSGKLEKDSISECVEIILNSSERAADMIQRLLTLSRKKSLTIIPTDLNHTMEQVIKICEKTLDKSIKLVPEFFNDTAIAIVDATQIEQVLLNICVNAGHAMSFMRPENENWGGTLTIELDHFSADKNFCRTHPDAKEGNYWSFTVADTGIGMDSETLSKAFNPFFTTKEDGKGTGLGLSMAYNIIKQHNGFIDIHSKENEGTIVYIYLPVPEEIIKTTEDKEAEKDNNINIHGGGLILITDDEEITRKTAKKMLETCGYDVITAKNGIECVEIYSERHKEIKAVLLDMSMPEMSGKDAYLRIKEINSDVKVLFSSGYKQDSRIDEVLKLGVDGFIQKPYTFEKLAGYINKIINNKQAL